MPRATAILTNVTAGEMTPLLAGRVDLAKYHNTGEIVRNFLIRTQGPISKRPGTEFMAEAKYHDKRCRLIDFQFSATQAYILEFGDYYIRFFMNKGQILNGPVIYEIASPYLEAELRGIRYIQSADVMTLCQGNHWPRQLSRTGHTAWTLAEMELVDGPYLEPNATGTTITPSAATGDITLTASVALFQAGHVGAYWRLAGGWVKITAVTGPYPALTASATVKGGSVSATATWREGAFSTYRGFPASLAYYEQRLYFAGTASKPQTIWGSKSTDYPNFAPQDTITDDGPVTYTIPSVSGQINIIKWLASGRALLAGTINEEITLAGGNDTALTPSNPPVIRGNTFKGSADLPPVWVGNAILFVQRHGRKLRELAYSFADDAYVAPDLTIWSEHITESGLVAVAYQREPDQCLWAVRTDGMLLSMVYERAQEVVGWSRHDTDGLAESVACIPGVKQTEVWLAVQHTINGAVKRYIECFRDVEFGADQKDCFFVDCGLTYGPAQGPPTAVISGLEHLEGKEVAILTDGAVHPRRTVTDGRILLDFEAATVQAGLPYRAQFLSPRIEAGATDGTAQGKIKRVDQVTMRLDRSLGGMVGPDLDNLEPLIYREVADPTDQCIPLFSGDREIDFRGEYDTKGQVMIVHDEPLPLTICALIPKLTTFEG